MTPRAGASVPTAVFLMGPTAAGKTDLAVALVARMPLDIVSVDSAMVYRGMDIGTAKPDAATLARAPHRLIDVCDPSEAYSAARFREDALQAMAEITASGRIPLLVGGTMLYYRALERGLAELPGADPAVRGRLEQTLQEQGLAALHRRLEAVDPHAAARIHRNDPQRTLRALEVWEITGRPLSALQAEHPVRDLPYRVFKLVCAPPDRALLHRRIATRFAAMLERGLVDEVAGLLGRPGIRPELPAMRTVGYRQVAGYLAGHYGYREMVERGTAATRQLAKRQMTWLRHETRALWLDPAEPEAVSAAFAWIRDRLPKADR